MAYHTHLYRILKAVSVLNVRDQDERGRSSWFIVLNSLAKGADIFPFFNMGKLAECMFPRSPFDRILAFLVGLALICRY